MVVRGHKGAHYNEMGQLTRFVSCREYLRVTRAGKREAPRHLALSRYQRVHEVHEGEEIAEARTRRGNCGGEEEPQRHEGRAPIVLHPRRSSVCTTRRKIGRGEARLNWGREEARNFTSRREGTGGQAPVICNPYAQTPTTASLTD